MLDFSEEKLKILNKTELDEVDQAFDVGALRVLAARYLLRNEDGIIIESPKQMFERIAILVAISDILHDERVFDINSAQVTHTGSIYLTSHRIGQYNLNQYHMAALERLYRELDSAHQMKLSFSLIYDMVLNGEFDSYEARIKEYYDLMVSKDFLPNTPTIMNAGAPLGQLSACFVLDLEDSMEAIMDTAKDVAMIFKSGGGVGINYSKLRPEGDMVSSTSGVASGPISFMRIVDAVTNTVKQGGKRRGANMGILDATHPDIDDFIAAKTEPGVLENFNVSVGIDKEFWDAVLSNGFYELKNPRNGQTTGVRYGHHMMEWIAKAAYKSAEPGLIFFDNINKHNPLITQKGPLTCTNPCGEQALYPYESCNLGSINLANFVKDGGVDWARYNIVIKLATRFLDNIIDVNKYPLARIDEETKKTRRIGLGIMGLADVLFKLDVPYNSKDGYYYMDRFAEILSWISMQESSKLARDRGSYPLYNKDEFLNNFPVAGAEGDDYWKYLKDVIAQYGIRNAWTTTIAPTGTLSMLAHCSNGVEPMFALSYEKHVTVGKFSYLNEIFMEKLRNEGMKEEYIQILMERIVKNYGSCNGVMGIPLAVSNVFVTAMDIHWADHIYAEAVWQKWISNAIAKTINMPADATIEDVERAYLIAHELGLKGITVYRDGSRHEQVLHIAGDKVRKFEVHPSEAVKGALANLSDNEYIMDEVHEVLYQAIPLPLMTGVTATSKVNFTMGGGKAFVGCPSCGASTVSSEGCHSCRSCGWSACSSG